jgi:N-dimethylarginine dimethylaminohydrolase
MTHKWPQKILMVRPNGFRVEYAINPYMRDAEGRLQQVDTAKANAQWENLLTTFERLGMQVEILEGDPKFPDMVFCANQTLPYPGADGRLRIVLGRMQSANRQGETAHFHAWAARRAVASVEITDYDFEGCGDAIWNYETRELIGGYGFRSDHRAYAQLEKLTGLKFHLVRLISDGFYHLDTCFTVLNATTAAYVPEAFDRESADVLRSVFRDLIRIDEHEARMRFAGNALCVDGRHVVLQAGAEQFKDDLVRRGFVPVEVETSEFMKSGGSVFCMKQVLF